jgi:tetratricopeptide (TPR) repeat protein
MEKKARGNSMKKITLIVILILGVGGTFLLTGCAGTQEEDPFGDTAIVETTPPYIVAYNKGYTQAAAKNWAGAVPFYEEAEAHLMKLSEEQLKEPDTENIYQKTLMGLALAYGNMGNMGKSAGYFKKYINRWPADINGYLNYGAILEKNGQSEDAFAQYTKAMNVNPKSAVAEFALASIYRQDGRLDDAITYYKKGLAKDPGFQDGNGWFQLGKTYEDKGDYDGQIKAYEEMIRVRPDDWQAYFFLADAYLTKGMKVGAEKARLTSADRELRISYYDKAINTDKKGLSIRPDSAQIMTHLASSLIRKAEMYNKGTTQYAKIAEESIGVLEQFTKVYPDNEKGYALLADAQQKLRNFTGAIANARKSLEIMDNAYAHSILGDVFFILERWQESKVHYQAIASNPQYPYVRGRLEIIEARIRGEY